VTPDYDEMDALQERVQGLKEEVIVIRTATSKNVEEIRDIRKDGEFYWPMVREHEKILKGEGKEASLLDDVREVKKFVANVNFWLRTIAVMLVGQFIVLGVAALMFFIRVMPWLQAQAAK
jgi:hypothetical protein